MVKEIKSIFQLDTKGAIENIKRLKKELNTLTSISKINERFGAEGIHIPSSRMNKADLASQVDNLHLKEKATRASNAALKEQNRLERVSKQNQREMDKLFREISRVKQKNLKEESKAQMLVVKAKKYNNDALKEQEKLNQKVTKSMLGMGFSMLFGGMALKRFTQSALKGMINTYSEIMGKTSTFHQMTNKLTGAWEFFKFTLIDALMQSGLFQTLLDFIISTVHWFGEFAAKHPAIAAMLPTLLLIGNAIGTISMVFGQFLLAYVSWKMFKFAKLAAGAKSSVSWLSRLKNLSFSSLLNKFKELGAGLATHVIDAVKWITANPIKTLFKVGIWAAIAMLLYGLYNVVKAVGGIKGAASAMSAGVEKLFWGSLIIPANHYLNELYNIFLMMRKVGDITGSSALSHWSNDMAHTIANLEVDIQKWGKNKLIDINTRYGIGEIVNKNTDLQYGSNFDKFLGMVGVGNKAAEEALREQIGLQKETNKLLEDAVYGTSSAFSNKGDYWDGSQPQSMMSSTTQ